MELLKLTDLADELAVLRDLLKPSTQFCRQTAISFATSFWQLLKKFTRHAEMHRPVALAIGIFVSKTGVALFTTGVGAGVGVGATTGSLVFPKIVFNGIFIPFERNLVIQLSIQI